MLLPTTRSSQNTLKADLSLGAQTYQDLNRPFKAGGKKNICKWYVRDSHGTGGITKGEGAAGPLGLV